MIKQICKIKGYENVRDIYYIDEKGNVYSYGNYGKGKSDNYRILKPAMKKCGYLYVTLMDNNSKAITYRLHRIVASAFVPNPDNLPYVNHLDEVKSNNYYKNLEWTTPKGNNDYSISKTIFCYDKEGNLISVYNSVRDASNSLQCNVGHIASCARGEIKYHKGYIFSYEPLTKSDVIQRLSKPYYLKDDMNYLRSRRK